MKKSMGKKIGAYKNVGFWSGTVHRSTMDCPAASGSTLFFCGAVSFDPGELI
jgi:hypothetical protein